MALVSLPRLRRYGRLAAGIALPLLCAGTTQAQSLGGIEQRLSHVEQAVRQIQGHAPPVPAPAQQIDREHSLSADALVQLDRRLAAIERAVAGLVSGQEQDHHTLTAALTQMGGIKADIEARIDAIERQAAIPQALGANGAQVPGPPPVTVPAKTPTAEDQFQQALDYAARQDWPQAELTFDNYIASYPDAPNVPEARFHLGEAFEGQGKHAQAAQIFLDLYEKVPAASFAIANLFALGQALAAMGPASQAQACDVYGEIEAVHGASLTNEQRSDLLVRRLTLKCAS